MTRRQICSAIILIFFLSAAAGSSDSECVYTLYVKTGSVIKAGTDSKISATLGDAAGRLVQIPDLRAWGLMGTDHDYYERDNLDLFTGRGPCIGSPICSLNLTSDGSGHHHGWFCDYVEVTSTGPHKGCSQSIFYVEQWLSTDAFPYVLTALVDGCARQTQNLAVTGRSRNGPLVVRNIRGAASSL